MESQQRAHLMAGVLLIVVGLVFLVGQQSWEYAHLFRLHRLWPLFLLVIGIAKMMQTPDARHPGARGAGGWMIFIAVLFLLNNFHVLPLGQSWPLFIVAAGVTMIVHRHKDSGRPVQGGQS